MNQFYPLTDYNLQSWADKSKKNKKNLHRATRSFNGVGQNIAAPTPHRKLVNISLPNSPNPRKRFDGNLYGEAGQEVQNIMYSAPTSPIPTRNERLNIQLNEEMLTRSLEALRGSISSPPLRSVNPVPLNSSFQVISKVIKPKPKLSHNHRGKSTRISCDAEGRGRSKSWPSLPIIV